MKKHRPAARPLHSTARAKRCYLEAHTLSTTLLQQYRYTAGEQRAVPRGCQADLHFVKCGLLGSERGEAAKR
jgi:hypothetical protein